MSKPQTGHIQQHHQTANLCFGIPHCILQGENIASEYVVYWNFVWITFFWKINKHPTRECHDVAERTNVELL